MFTPVWELQILVLKGKNFCLLAFRGFVFHKTVYIRLIIQIHTLDFINFGRLSGDVTLDLHSYWCKSRHATSTFRLLITRILICARLLINFQIHLL